MTQEAADVVCDTLRYAKRRGYSIDLWLLPDDAATLVVSRPISHESTPIATGCYDDMVRFVEYWREMVVSQTTVCFSDPVRVSVACFLRDRKSRPRKKAKYRTDDDLDRKALEIWQRHEQPEYYSVRALEQRSA